MTLGWVEAHAHEVAELRARLRTETAKLRRFIIEADEADARHEALVQRAHGGLSRKLVYALFSDDNQELRRERFAWSRCRATEATAMAQKEADQSWA